VLTTANYTVGEEHNLSLPLSFRMLLFKKNNFDKSF
jgi:hypothetical protein